jgi:hypothetical protein
VARTDTDDPNLSIKITSFKAILILRGFANASRYFTYINNFKGSGFNVVRVALRQPITTILP